MCYVGWKHIIQMKSWFYYIIWGEKININENTILLYTRRKYNSVFLLIFVFSTTLASNGIMIYPHKGIFGIWLKNTHVGGANSSSPFSKTKKLKPQRPKAKRWQRRPLLQASLLFSSLHLLLCSVSQSSPSFGSWQPLLHPLTLQVSILSHLSIWLMFRSFTLKKNFYLYRLHLVMLCVSD